jgi:hypothetical protein
MKKFFQFYAVIALISSAFCLVALPIEYFSFDIKLPLYLFIWMEVIMIGSVPICIMMINKK